MLNGQSSYCKIFKQKLPELTEILTSNLGYKHAYILINMGPYVLCPPALTSHLIKVIHFFAAMQTVGKSQRQKPGVLYQAWPALGYVMLALCVLSYSYFSIFIFVFAAMETIGKAQRMKPGVLYQAWPALGYMMLALVA